LETTARGGKLDSSVGNSSNDYKNSVGDLGVYRRGVNGLKAGVLGLCMLVGVGSMSGCGALYGIDPVTTALIDSSPSFMAPLGARKKIEIEREERERSNSKEKSSIEFQTKEGYNVRIAEDAIIKFEGNKYLICSIDYPDIILAPEKGLGYSLNKKFPMNIKDLVNKLNQ